MRDYTWGLDLSGSEQGAGGAGGLLFGRLNNGAALSTFVYTYDGNGNVATLVRLDSGAVGATYEYGTFGEPMGMTGAAAKDNPFRFSSKYQDCEAELLYYGYRYYQSQLGRWISRDPLEENDGPNQYGFTLNNAVDRVDFLGLRTLTITLKRNYRGYLAVYGELTAVSDDEEANRCCGLPKHFYTLESVGVPLRRAGTYNPVLNKENSWTSGKGFTSIAGKVENGVNQGWWRRDQAYYPSLPPGMSQSDYNAIVNSEFRTNGADGINVHFGPTVNHSTGCALLGSKYCGAVIIPSGDRFGEYSGQPYRAWGFDLNDSIQSQFDLFAAIRCVQKRGASLRYVVENNIDQVSEGIPLPVPLRPGEF